MQAILIIQRIVIDKSHIFDDFGWRSVFKSQDEVYVGEPSAIPILLFFLELFLRGDSPATNADKLPKFNL